MSSSYDRLESVIADPAFPDVDLDLRRGKHIGRDDGAAYQLLVDGQEHLEAFYQRYSCELMHRADGFFFLLPTGDRLGRRQLTPAEMLVGQVLALFQLEPATLQRGGVVSKDDMINRLQHIVSLEALVRLFHSKKKKNVDERTAKAAIRGRLDEATRGLAALGFVELLPSDMLRLRPALFRFADPVRSRDDAGNAMQELIRRGEVAAEAATEEES